MKSYQTKYRNTNDTTLAIDQNKIWAANGVFAMAFHVDLPEKYSLGEDDLEAINDFWHKAFKYLPTNTIICKQDMYAQRNLSTHAWSDTNFLQRSTKSYFNNRPYLEHSCNLFFVQSSIDTFFNDKIQNPFKRLTKKKYTQYDDKIRSFIDAVENTVSFLIN